MTRYNAPFDLQDKVYIDGKDELLGTITEVSFRHDGLVTYVLYQVEWLHNGANHAAYIAGWRLTKSE
jgi:hypothetical protein